MMHFEISLSKPLPSLANARMHWVAKAKAVKTQRQRVALALMVESRGGRLRDMVEVSLARGDVVQVTLTRIAPRRLDDDNLAHAFKATRDELAKKAGLDDGNSHWRWRYAQETGGPAVRVEVELLGGAP